MSIKYTPKDLHDHHEYITRKKITKTTYASKDLISRASESLESAQIAQYELSKLNIPYVNGTTVIFYSTEKIILQSDKDILKPKISELHSQLIIMLNKHHFFSKLKKVEIQIFHREQKIPNKLSIFEKKRIKEHLEYLRDVAK